MRTVCEFQTIGSHPADLVYQIIKKVEIDP